MFIPFRIKDRSLVERLVKTSIARHSKWFGLKPDLITISSVEKAYVPFIAFRIRALSSIHALLKSNGSTEDRKSVSHLIAKTYDSSKDLQLPATYSICQKSLGCLKCDDIDELIKESTKEIPQDQNVNIYPFAISPAILFRESAEPFIQREELRRVFGYLKHKYSDRFDANSVDHQVKFDDIEPRQAYVPAYIVKYTVDGSEEFHAILNAINGDLHTIKHLDHGKISYAATYIGSLCGLLFSIPSIFTLKTISLFVAKYQLLPYLLSGRLTRAYAVLQKYRQEFDMKQRQDKDSKQVKGFSFSDTPIFTSKMFENFYEWQNVQGQKESTRTYSEYEDYINSVGRSDLRKNMKHSDTKGYYSALGLTGKEVAASEEEISRAFKKLASFYHPDNRESGNQEIFKKLSEAHNVLKDSKRRKEYDRINIRV